MPCREMKVIYSPFQISCAAKFLCKKNPVAKMKGRKEVESDILALIKRHVRDCERDVSNKKGWRITGTLGYYVICLCEDSRTLHVEVLVDASAGKSSDHQYLQ